MTRFNQCLRCTLLLLSAAAGGCRVFDAQPVVQGHSPLRPAVQSPDSVALEMMWVRFAEDDPALNDAAWQGIDETQIAPETRSELAANGFRAGIIRGNVPDAMARALDAYKTSPAKEGNSATGDGELAGASNSALELTNDPIVRGRRKQLKRNERWEIQASEVYPSMPLLFNKGHAPLTGRTYADAQAMYALRVDPQSDRTVLVELTPELHIGPTRLRFTSGEEGIMRSQLRDREVFERLRMNVRLAPGEMLVLMSLPNSGSRLGDYFHAVDSSDGRQQKLILLRLVQVPPSDTFADER